MTTGEGKARIAAPRGRSAAQPLPELRGGHSVRACAARRRGSRTDHPQRVRPRAGAARHSREDRGRQSDRARSHARRRSDLRGLREAGNEGRFTWGTRGARQDVRPAVPGEVQAVPQGTSQERDDRGQI